MKVIKEEQRAILAEHIDFGEVFALSGGTDTYYMRIRPIGAPSEKEFPIVAVDIETGLINRFTPDTSTIPVDARIIISTLPILSKEE